MIIHKTHSKKDLIEIFKELKIYLNKLSSKCDIMTEIDEKIDDCQYNKEIKNKTELIDYLKNETTKQRPNISEKKRMMLISKKVIKYCNNDCMLNESTFDSHESCYNSLISICKWGDIPSVRRACKLYNKSCMKINHINPKISPSVERDIINKRLIKKVYITSLKIKRGTKENPIVVKFD